MIRTLFNDAAARAVSVLLALVLVPTLVSAQSVDDKYRRARDRGSHFNLASAPDAVLRVNQYQCGLSNNGDTCTDVFDSPTGGGSFWPTGSPNQYMFNSGLQTSGIIPRAADCTIAMRDQMRNGALPPRGPDCFAWSGDTVGAFFMDAAGTRKHATPLTDIYDSLNPQDLENWPTAGTFPDFPFASAMLEDTTLFNDVLVGRKAASQQDTWVMYWDGDPVRTGGRTHPMGIAVEQRTMAWNYPTGNESVIYFIYKFTNVTNNPLFQRLSETRYAIQLPDAGWRIDSMYVAYMADPDVTHDYDLNYSTASFPFNLGVAYDGSFFEPDFVYPPQLFFPPFFTNAPGILGVKYLRSPINTATGQEVGLTSFSLTTNVGAFPDPSTVQRGWRYHSLNIDPGKGDANCTFPLAEIKARRSCYLAQVTADVRFFIGSGPFSLEPGQSSTIATAQYAAATVNTSEIKRGANERNPPGFPTTAPGCNGEPIRPIDIAMGYIGPKAGRCPAPGQAISQFDVNVVPQSVLGRALIAQAIFDNKFLLGFAPETPPFYLVPGDNQVSIVWEQSPTETAGDPFFSAAGNPASNLFDPNYREFDVEGYRIYRGTSPANMQMIAQFDKTGTTFTDRLCVFDPEHITGTPCTEVEEIPITSPFVQFTSVAPLASGALFQFASDTAMNDRVLAGTGRALTDTGIPFAYIDRDVRNGFQYFYRVTAFDINSIRSGPSSLESAGPTKTVIPTAPAGSLVGAKFGAGLFGRGNTPLPPGLVPGIDPNTGMFSGPQQPTNGFTGEFLAFVTQLLPAGVKQVRIDSVQPMYYPVTTGCTRCGGVSRLFVTVDGVAQPVIPVDIVIASGTQQLWERELPQIPIFSDPSLRQALQAKGVEAPGLAGNLATALAVENPHWHSNAEDYAFKQTGFWHTDPPTGNSPGGSRWFVGANESTPHPALGVCRWGALPGYQIFKPHAYYNLAPTCDITGGAKMTNFIDRTNGASRDSDLMRRFYASVFGLQRSADVKIYWGAAGVDSVIDVTHNLPVPFHPHLRASYGFLADGDANGVLNYADFLYIPTGLDAIAHELMPMQIQFPNPLRNQPVVLPTDVNGNLTGDGAGFGLFLAGEPYLFTGPVPTNTVWTLRMYNGSVTQNNAGLYAFEPMIRSIAIPGLSFSVNVEAPAQIVADSADLTRVHTVPDPYYVTSQFDLGPTSKELQFVNLPAESTVRIYSLSGVLVHVINHSDPVGSGIAKWNLRNRSNQFVASGVYLFHVSTPEGKSHIGRFTVVNAGFGR
jgi:hypothetical protein